MGIYKDTEEMLETFVQQFEVNLAQVEKTCHELGIDSKTVLRWRREHPDFDEKLNRVQMLLNEDVEKSLVELAMNKEKPNVVAKIFYLKNNWNQKYGERPMEREGDAVLWFEQRKPELLKEDNVVVDSQRDLVPVDRAPDSQVAGQ